MAKFWYGFLCVFSFCAFSVMAGYNVGYVEALEDVCEKNGNVWVDAYVGCVSELDTIPLVD